jgi:hypothetical protein
MSNEKDDNKRFREKCRLIVAVLMRLYFPDDPQKTVEMIEKYMDELKNREDYLHEN